MDFMSQSNVEISGRRTGWWCVSGGWPGRRVDAATAPGPCEAASIRLESKSSERQRPPTVFIEHVICHVASESSSTTMTGPASAPRQDPDFDFWDFVSCAVCHISYSSPDRGPPPVPFWITECGHVLCNSHLGQFLSFAQTSALISSTRPEPELCEMQ